MPCQRGCFQDIRGLAGSRKKRENLSETADLLQDCLKSRRSTICRAKLLVKAAGLACSMWEEG